MPESAEKPDTPLSNTPEDKEVVFHVHGVTKVYQMGEVQVRALRGIDLDLYKGELVVMLGPPAAVNRRCLISSAGWIHPPRVTCNTPAVT